ncbi:hydroxyisourate hydrolase [Ascoidea rubescens DSM 1968]|uniref:5-hydroxyisourate hydrolase n=1 Tax=Ascoidea rubescens DSM 1968 TaxID=1344418 RepID=A0A1D2VPQ9_9ASCO|nr:Hydroxyisourate hydrolase [Ascoidea rubescens DSM 1968]ODV63535.1 Hydroxyisourate hydrolase [Ascoidea rubescens DSM 1968]
MASPPVTCHILDTTTGRPAQSVLCAIYHLSSNPNDLPPDDDLVDLSVDEPSAPFGLARTNSDGRITSWSIKPRQTPQFYEMLGVNSSLEWDNLKPGLYKIRFHTAKYFLRSAVGAASAAQNTFFPFVDIHFIIKSPPDSHYHVPLLLSNHGYTTYRGS